MLCVVGPFYASGPDSDPQTQLNSYPILIWNIAFIFYSFRMPVRGTQIENSQIGNEILGTGSKIFWKREGEATSYISGISSWDKFLVTKFSVSLFHRLSLWEIHFSPFFLHLVVENTYSTGNCAFSYFKKVITTSKPCLENSSHIFTTWWRIFMNVMTV